MPTWFTSTSASALRVRPVEALADAARALDLGAHREAVEEARRDDLRGVLGQHAVERDPHAADRDDRRAAPLSSCITCQPMSWAVNARVSGNGDARLLEPQVAREHAEPREVEHRRRAAAWPGVELVVPERPRSRTRRRS